MVGLRELLPRPERRSRERLDRLVARRRRLGRLGNEPFYANGTHSLSLPSGSTATSATTCIGAGDLYVRMFGADRGGSDAGLHVRVVWYGLLNKVLGITDVNTYSPGSDWAPTDKLSSSGGSIAIPLLPIVGSTSARVQLTPIGSGSRWLVDDLYIDPTGHPRLARRSFASAGRDPQQGAAEMSGRRCTPQTPLRHCRRPRPSSWREVDTHL